MENINLKPFGRENLDILFIGLNPAVVSNQKGHYFSVKQSLWSQLYKSGLILEEVNKDYADELIFGDTARNIGHSNFGITDLVANIANSNSSEVKPTQEDCRKLEQTILKYKPRIAIILHSKVLKMFAFKHLGISKKCPSNSGYMGKLLEAKDCDTIFYNIAFPHSNTIPDEDKIKRYTEVKELILKIQKTKSMKGKSCFTKNEVTSIKELIKKKLQTPSDKQINVRNKIRRIGFYWEDYHPKDETPRVEYNVENFEKLITNGDITITE